MRKLLLFLLLVISMVANAQSDDQGRYIKYPAQYGMRMPRLWADSVLHIPYLDTAQLILPNGTKAQAGALQCRPQDKLFYRWDGDKWVVLGGSVLPADWSYVTTEGDCHDTAFVAAAGDYQVRSYYNIPVPVGFIGQRIRVYQGGLPVSSLPQYGFYYTWNMSLGALRLYSYDTCPSGPFNISVTAY